jgi:hypothetical protein
MTPCGRRPALTETGALGEIQTPDPQIRSLSDPDLIGLGAKDCQQHRQAARAIAEADNASIRIAASIWLVVWPLVVRTRSAAAANATHIPDALF